MIENKLPSQILKEAARTLEMYGWNQGNFIGIDGDNGSICFCAHGAIEYCSNQKFKQLVGRHNFIISANHEALKRSEVGLAAGHVNKNMAIHHWKLYPEFEKDTNILLAHNYAYRVGLSFGFNDAKNTTKEEVIAKLNEASVLAALDEMQEEMRGNL